MIFGGILGHILCTGLAVLGGRMIAQKISVRTGKYSAYLFLLTVKVSVLVLLSAQLMQMKCYHFFRKNVGFAVS